MTVNSSLPRRLVRRAGPEEAIKEGTIRVKGSAMVQTVSYATLAAQGTLLGCATAPPRCLQLLCAKHEIRDPFL